MTNGLESLHDDDDYKLDNEDNLGGDNPTEEEIAANAALAKEQEEKLKATGRVTNPEHTPDENEAQLLAEKAAAAAANENGEKLSGIEAYLSQYNIKGGMITTLDSEGKHVQKHFDELTPTEQEMVLNKLASDHRPSIEESLGLVDEEIELLNAFRGAKKPVNEFINELAIKKAQEIINFQNSGGENFKDMSDDAIMTRNLKDQYPDATQEDIEAELLAQKASKFYEGNVKTIRDKYTQDQALLEAQTESARNNMILQQQDEDRVTIATVVDGIKDVVGWSINNDDKNAVLADLLEVNEYGDSKFMEKIYSSPTELFKAAWLYNNAEKRIDSLEKYWKKRESAAFQEGKAFVTNGMPSEPINASDPGLGSGGNYKPDAGIERKEKGTTLSELHDED